MKKHIFTLFAISLAFIVNAQSPLDDGTIVASENFDAAVVPTPPSNYFSYTTNTSQDFKNSVNISSTAANGSGLGVEFYYDASFSTDEEIKLHTFTNVAPGDYIIQYDINADFQGFSFESVISDGTVNNTQTVGIQNGHGAFQKRYSAQITIGSVSDLSFVMQMSPFVTGFTSSLVYMDNIELIKMNDLLPIPTSCTTLIQDENYDAATTPPSSTGYVSFTNSVGLSANADVNGTGQGVEFSYTAFYNEVVATVDLATFNNVSPGTYFIQYDFDESNTQTYVALSMYNEISDGTSDSLNYIVLDTLTGFTKQRTYPITITSASNLSLRFIAGETLNNIQGAVSYYIDNVELIEVGAGVTSTDAQVACDSYTWIDGNTYTASNNTATFTIVNGTANGCDSIVTLDLTINTATTGTDVISGCNPIIWIDGMTYSASNNTAMHTIVGGAANGCDSIVTLDFTLNSGSTGTDVISDCNPITWIDGMTYSASNNTAMHTIAGGAANGCDSIVTLDFTLNSGSTGTDAISDCNPITWIDGMMYSASNNTAMHTIAGGAANGCDSIVTLDFTLNSGSTGTDVISDCNPITWIDGMTYSASNNTAMHTIAGGAANGCDSIVTLDFTLNSGSTGTDVISDCNPITWIDGMTYSASNNTAMFTIVGGAANGCDSIVTLDFTLNSASMGTDVISSCNPITWIDGMMYSASNNTAMFTIVGGAANGCDSIVTLDFTLNSASMGTDVISSCDPLTWIDGMTYTASNNTSMFTIPGGAANGCDSIVTLDFTLNTVGVAANVAAANITSFTADVTWDLISAFDITVQYREIGTIPWTTITGISSAMTMTSLTGLNENTTYEVAVIANCSATSVGTASSGFFTTNPISCGTPIALSVSNNTGASVALSWTSVLMAGWYEIRYKQTSSSTWISGGTIGGAGTSKIISGLTPSASYDFEARTYCPDGSSSAWSTTLTVSANALSGCGLAPAVMAPIVNGTSATITWTSVTGAGWYAFRYKPSASTTWINGGSAAALTTSKTYNGLMAGTMYDFEARTYCSNGTPSAWGAFNFTTSSLVGCELPPVLDLTAMTTSMNSITISWPPVIGAGWYSFQYKESSSTVWLSGGSASGSLTSKTYLGLTAGTSYDFQGRSYCSTGIASSWSATGTYMTDGGPPAMIVNDAPNDKVAVINNKTLSAKENISQIYPNPATDKINVDIHLKTESENSTVRLLDMSGRVVREISTHTKKGRNTIAMDVQNLSNGVYTLMIYQNDGLIHTAKVKKK